MNDFLQTETLDLATAIDEKSLSLLRILVEEGLKSGDSIAFDANKIKKNSHKKLQALYALQNSH